MDSNHNETFSAPVDASSASQGVGLDEAAFRSFCEGAPEGIFVVEIATKQANYANAAFARMFGYSQDEIMSLCVADLHPPEALPGVERDFEALVKGELDISTQPCLRQDGSVFLGQIHAWTVKVKGCVCAVGFFTDITERQQVEEELRHNKAALQERVKELDCLYSISRLVESKDTSMDDVLMGVANLLPPSWQYTDIVCATIRVDEKEYCSKTDCDCSYAVARISSDILVSGRCGGTVSVCYIEDRPEADEGPFLTEERRLLDSVAEHLGRIIERHESEDELQKARELAERIIEDGPIAITEVDSEGRIVRANHHAEHLLQLNKSDIEGRRYNAPDWRVTDVDGSPFPDERQPFQQIMRTGKAVYDVRHAIITSDGTRKILSINGAPLHDSQGQINRIVFTIQDITLSEEHEAHLHKIAWMLDKEAIVEAPPSQLPFYGDVSELNTERTIRDSVGLKTLESISTDIMTLLDTSLAVYEKNGDYAYGNFVSEWCSLMDGSSRKLCQTEDNREALSCGRWLCHETCWNYSAKAAMESGEPTDIACVGGIRMYGVPIYAGDEVVGAINIGYGNPPTDESTLSELAAQYNTDIELLRRAALAFNPRPAFIVEAAKARLQLVARQIGQMVENHRAQSAIQHSKDLLDATGRMAKVGGWELDAKTNEVTWTAETYRIYDLPMGSKPPLTEALKYYHPEDRPILEQALRDALEKGQPFDLELRFISAKGRELVTRALCTPIMEADKVVGLRGAFQDITERKNIERKLKLELKRYRQTFDKNSSVKLVIDPIDGQIVEANNAAVEFYGYDMQTLTSMKINAINVLGEDEIAEEMKRAESEDRLYFEFQHRLADGSIRDVEVYSGPLESEGTTLLYSIIHDITTQKERERELANSEQRLALATRSAGIGIWDWDIVNDKMTWDEQMFRLYGIAEIPEHYGVEIWEKRIHPEDKDLAWNASQASLLGEKYYDAEFRVCWPDGTVRYIKADGVVIRDDEGEAIRMLGTNYDITERKEGERELRESESRFQSLYANMTEMVVLHELVYDASDNPVDYRILECNPAFCSVTGLAESAAVGKLASAIYTTGQPPCLDVYSRVASSGRPEQFEIYFAPLEKYFRVSAFRTGQYRFGTIAEDITERKLAEDQIQALEQRNRALLDHSPVCHKIIDLDLNLQYMNASGFRMLKLEKTNELFGKPYPFDFFPEASRDRLKTELTTVIKTMELVAFDDRACDTEGKQIWLHHSLIPVLDDDGTLAYITVVSADVTDQKKMQEQLLQSEKMDAIGQLAGGVAHDFNNQLAGIMGYADLLRGRLDDPDMQRYAETVLIGARRASDLTKKLLAFARKGQYQTILVDIHNIIHEVVGILSHSIDKKIEIKQHLTASPSITLGDPTQLQNAILNLGINAADAMTDGGELVFATNVADLDDEYCSGVPYDIIPGPYLRVSVTDSGVGIPKENLERIFEPFFTTKDIGKGTGMGLAAVYGTVKGHNGSVNVYSEIAHGTTFNVYLPVEKRVAQRIRRSTDMVFAPHENLILVVDDEEIVRNMSADMLEVLGYKAVTANNGKAALRYFEEHWQEVDLVVLDMVMPIMNGTETYRAMKAIDPDVKVILASGYSITGAAQVLLEEGVHGFIQKPFDRTDFSVKVAEAIKDSPE